MYYMHKIIVRIIHGVFTRSLSGKIKQKRFRRKVRVKINLDTENSKRSIFVP